MTVFVTCLHGTDAGIVIRVAKEDKAGVFTLADALAVHVVTPAY